MTTTANFFRGTVVTLVPKDTADRLKLPTVDVEPDTIPGPTTGDVEGAAPSQARLHAGNDEVALTSVPTIFPVPRGMRVAQDMTFDNYHTHTEL